MTASLEASTRTSMIIAILTGATATELFAALRQFQFFNAVSMVEINYSANVVGFYEIMVEFSSLDVF